MSVHGAYPALPGIRYVQYQSSKEREYVPKIRQLISHDLSEPYSIYVYRYFLYQWGDLCFMVSLELKGVVIMADFVRAGPRR